MGGSQLKQLKAALKLHGLIGQPNVKKSKGENKKQSKHYDREERAQVLSKIREQFNPFEVKTNRNKRDITLDDTKVAVGKPGISKQIGEDQRKKIYEIKKSKKNKKGGVFDKRFGEKNKDLSVEEIMLERFTKERQNQSKSKKSLFDLDDNILENNMDNDELTHFGQSLAFVDDFDTGDLGIDEGARSNKRDYPIEYMNNDNQPSRKKTKAEVMQEIIAKSKYYKHERQKAQEKLEDQIADLDDDFDDVMSELRSYVKPKSNILDSKLEKDVEYDMKVKELNMDRRAVPTDATKTEEQLQIEHDENIKRLEQDRINRMNGMFENEIGADDLDEMFWQGSDSDDGMFEYMDNLNVSNDDIKLDEKIENTPSSHKLKMIHTLPCPSSHDELVQFLSTYPFEEHVSLVKQIVMVYQPKLAEGNKIKLAKFSGVLLKHIIFITQTDYSSNVTSFKKVQNGLISILKSLSEKYNTELSEACRVIIKELQDKFNKYHFDGLSPGDLVFFSIVGYLFSTSDRYHLVVTPCNIVIGELLEQLKLTSWNRIMFGSILANISLRYQDISKRYVPELVYFLEKALLILLPLEKSEKIEKQLINFKIDSYSLSIPSNQSLINTDPLLELHQLFDQNIDSNDKIKLSLFSSILSSLDIVISNVWKDISALPEIISPFTKILSEYSMIYPNCTKIQNIMSKVEKIITFHEHIPLVLQKHRPLAIPTYAPKFEENFDPNKKSYDPDMTRNEINKMKAQLKKERKFTMKEIRKDNKFEARQRIEEKKKEYSDYHTKMARIVNKISTEEGAEKNKYEKEKKLRNSKGKN